MNIERINQTSKFPAQVVETDEGISVVWQPGDGTRYVFVFTKLGTLLVSDGVPDDSILGTIRYAPGGDLSIPFGSGGLLHFGFAEEKLSALKNRSSLWAFVCIANWLYGASDYADGVYATMAERFAFESRL